jgi:hypothetical protein
MFILVGGWKEKSSWELGHLKSQLSDLGQAWHPLSLFLIYRLALPKS